MGASMFVTTEREVDAVDFTIDGKALALNEAELTARCEAVGVTPLSSFLSPSVDQQLAVMASFGITDVTPAGEQWFEAEDGLASVAVLLDAVREDPDGFYEHQALTRDLQRLHEILTVVKSSRVRWHLDVDF